MIAPAPATEPVELPEPIAFQLYHSPPPPRRGDPTGKPCELCGNLPGTATWNICEVCRWDRQRAADAAVKRLARSHPDW